MKEEVIDVLEEVEVEVEDLDFKIAIKIFQFSVKERIFLIKSI